MGRCVICISSMKEKSPLFKSAARLNFSFVTKTFNKKAIFCTKRGRKYTAFTHCFLRQIKCVVNKGRLQQQPSAAESEESSQRTKTRKAKASGFPLHHGKSLSGAFWWREIVLLCSMRYLFDESKTIDFNTFHRSHR